MSLAVLFEKEITYSLPILKECPKALEHARARLLEGVDQIDGNYEIIDVLNLACDQDDYYAFLSCTWLATQLAARAKDNHYNDDVEFALLNVTEKAKQFGFQGRVQANKLKELFRICDFQIA